MNRQSRVMRVFVLISSLIVILLSYYPTYYHWRNTPSDRVWAGTTFYSDDYAVYLHTIGQGARGRWTVLDKFTSEPHSGSLLHIYYLLFGKFWGFLGIHPTYSYHLMRLFASILILFAAWQFTKTVLQNNFHRSLAWLLILFSGMIPARLLGSDQTNWLPLLQEPDPTIRFASQSHHTLGSAFMLLSFTLFLRYLKRPTPKLLALAISISFLNSWIEPNTSFATIIVIGLVSIFQAAKSAIFGWRTNYHLNYSLFITLAAAPALLYFRLLHRTEPWKTLFIFDSFQHFNPAGIQLISGIGIITVLSILLLAPLAIGWKKLPNIINSPGLIITIAFVLQFVLMYFLAPFLNINRLRFYHQPFFIPLSILASISLFWLSTLVTIRYPKSLALILVLVLILISAPASYATLKSRIHEYDDLSTLVYPGKLHVAAFDWLQSHTPRDSVVLALYEASNVIPVFSNNTVYAGNISETINYDGKSKSATQFFQNKMNPDQAYQFLKNGNINYIYFGFQERQGLDPSALSYLTLVFQNPDAQIYEVE